MISPLNKGVLSSSQIPFFIGTRFASGWSAWDSNRIRGISLIVNILHLIHAGFENHRGNILVTRFSEIILHFVLIILSFIPLWYLIKLNDLCKALIFALTLHSSSFGWQVNIVIAHTDIGLRPQSPSVTETIWWGFFYSLTWMVKLSVKCTLGTHPSIKQPSEAVS